MIHTLLCEECNSPLIYSHRCMTFSANQYAHTCEGCGNKTRESHISPYITYRLVSTG